MEIAKETSRGKQAVKEPSRLANFLEDQPGRIIFSILFTLRLLNATNLRTFFQPDEYYQALEPAWQLAFGPDSGAWITWEWREGLRSSLHPMLFAGVYKLADYASEVIGADANARADALLVAPQVLQAVIAAAGDYYTWQLSRKAYDAGSGAATAAFVLTVASPWQWFFSVRTFSNSLETTLTVMALFYWPWDWYLGIEDTKTSKTDSSTADGSLTLSLILAALACILRPTNVIIWAVVAGMLYSHDPNKLLDLSQKAFVYGIALLACSFAADSAYYGKFTFPPLQFLQFNAVQSLSTFYGTNRPDYYLTEGLPLMLTTALPFAALGLWEALRSYAARQSLERYRESEVRFVLGLAVLVMLIVMTMVAHKEVRFIYPLLPILHLLAAKPFSEAFDPFPVPRSLLLKLALLLMLAANVFIAGYVSTVHQRGVIDVMHYLRHEQRAKSLAVSPGEEAKITVGFFMPCHSTPWRSYFIYPEIKAWALTCEPPLGLAAEERETYLDEADVFYKNPAFEWLEAHMEDTETIKASGSKRRPTESMEEPRPWPEYLVFFEQLLPTLEWYLQQTRYQECWRGFNTHWHDDKRRAGDVVVWCLQL